LKFILVDINIVWQKTNTFTKSKTKIKSISKIIKYLFNNLLINVDNIKSIFTYY